MRQKGSSLIRLMPQEPHRKILSYSAVETRNWGKKVGKLLDSGAIVGLTGDLGSGKTCFVRGAAEGLGVGKEAWIRSPTFTLVNEYDGRLPVYHIDLYRIGSAQELEELNLREYLYGDGVSLIEWFEKMPPAEVDEWLGIHFEHRAANEREITFEAQGECYGELLKRLKA
jgi:tRNA threonylcarbamoyladenosine biosynthesis protein TsaE